MHLFPSVWVADELGPFLALHFRFTCQKGRILAKWGPRGAGEGKYNQHPALTNVVTSLHSGLSVRVLSW